MWESRAVVRLIEQGVDAPCAGCGERIRFKARQRRERQVICNVYVAGLWTRVEHFHEPCYQESGRPYGPVKEGPARVR